MAEERPMHGLMNHFSQPGTLEWIGLRTGPRKPVESVSETYVRIGTGLDGDRYKGQPESKRQVTLISREHLDAVASFVGREQVDPADVRRNLVIRGVNLQALKGKQFKIGEVVLEYTGECHPCSRMEEVLGVGGYNAMRGHGGITAKVLQEGTIQVGDSLEVLDEVQASEKE